jgi:DNA-binding response OmpR family regulator
MSDDKQQPCILIVDDDQDVVAYLETLFADNGYRAITASSGDQGLKLARSEQPDLICLDISMPPPTGVRVYRTLRDDPELKGIPVVMITGVEREFEGFIKTRRQVPPPDGYHRKPFDPDEVLATVRKVLDRQVTAH